MALLLRPRWLLLALVATLWVPASASATRDLGHYDFTGSPIGILSCIETVNSPRVEYCVAAFAADGGVRVFVATGAQPAVDATIPSVVTYHCDPESQSNIRYRVDLPSSEEYLAPSAVLREVPSALGGMAVELDVTLPETGRVHLLSDARLVDDGGTAGRVPTPRCSGVIWGYHKGHALELGQGATPARGGSFARTTGSIAGREVLSDGPLPVFNPPPGSQVGESAETWVGPIEGWVCCP